MLVMDLVFVFLMAVLFSVLLTSGFGWRHPAREEMWPAGIFLFTILFLVMLGGGLWIEPWGPLVAGVAWVPYLMLGLLVLLLVLAAAAPARPSRTPAEAAQETEEATAIGAVFGVFFWILVVALLVSIVVRFL